jgi:hypothetical protein
MCYHQYIYLSALVIFEQLHSVYTSAVKMPTIANEKISFEVKFVHIYLSALVLFEQLHWLDEDLLDGSLSKIGKFPVHD